MTKHLLLLATIAAMALAGCAGQAQAVAPTERTIYMAVVEPKGSTTTAKEAFPAAALPEGGGYGLVPPNADGQWTVPKPSRFTGRYLTATATDGLGNTSELSAAVLAAPAPTATSTAGPSPTPTASATAGPSPTPTATRPPLGQGLLLPRALRP